MKYFAYLALIIFSCGISVFGQKAASTPAKPDPAKQVREVFDTLIEGIRDVDVEKAMSVYEKSDRILFFNNNGTATLGWETMKSNRESGYAKTTNVTIDVTGVRIEMLGSRAAYLTCKWKQTQEYEGKPESASGRMTLIFKLIGKEWKVVHLHTSPDNPPPTRPVLDSEKGKTETKP